MSDAPNRVRIILPNGESHMHDLYGEEVVNFTVWYSNNSNHLELPNFVAEQVGFDKQGIVWIKIKPKSV